MIASSGTLVYRETMKNLDFNTGKEIIYLIPRGKDGNRIVFHDFFDCFQLFFPFM